MANESPVKNAQFNVRVGVEGLIRLDNLRRREEDLPTRSKMMRRLIDRAHGILRDDEGEPLVKVGHGR